jgi:hypothetical protein
VPARVAGTFYPDAGASHHLMNLLFVFILVEFRLIPVRAAPGFPSSMISFSPLSARVSASSNTCCGLCEPSSASNSTLNLAFIFMTHPLGVSGGHGASPTTAM